MIVCLLHKTNMKIMKSCNPRYLDIFCKLAELSSNPLDKVLNDEYILNDKSKADVNQLMRVI